MFLKNQARSKSFELIVPKGFSNVENNSGQITNTYDLAGSQVIDRIAVASITILKLAVSENKIKLGQNFTLPDGTTEPKEEIMVFPSQGDDGITDPDVPNL